MPNLFDQPTTPENVNRAWKRLRNGKAPWRLGLTDEELRTNLIHHLLELLQELRNGSYRPDALRQFPHRKADGRMRVLSALTLRDKV